MDSGDEDGVLQQMVEAARSRPKKKTKDENLPMIEKERKDKKKKLHKIIEKKEKKAVAENSGAKMKKSTNGKASQDYDFNDFWSKFHVSILFTEIQFSYFNNSFAEANILKNNT